MATRKKEATIHIRMQPEVKETAERVARRHGLNLTALVTMLVMREAREMGEGGH